MAKIPRLEGSNFVARNLQWLIDQEHITQQGLADATGVGQPTINRILTGKNLRPRDATLHPLARHFDLAIEDLRDKDLTQNNGLSTTLRGIKIPMVSSKIAGKVKLTPQWPDRITVHRQVSPEAFAMDVSDAGMAPRINRGDTVVVEPKMMPQPGNIVAVRVDDSQAIVRIYKALESTKAKRPYELHPMDGNFPTLSSTRSDLQWLGVCVERHESLID